MLIRTLTADDDDAYQALRLQALELNPEAFAETIEEQKTLTGDALKSRVRPNESFPEKFILGAFEDSRLIGLVGFNRDGRTKLCHRGNVWGTFILPDYRGRGIARALFSKLIEKAKVCEGLKDLRLSVCALSLEAERLYRSFGFEAFGVDKGGLLVDGKYLDLTLMGLTLTEPGR